MRKTNFNVLEPAAFSFEDREEIERHKEIIQNGVHAFEDVYGYRPTVFTPPAQQLTKSLEPFLPEVGLVHLVKPFYRKRHYGNGKYKREINITGYDQDSGITTMVRNVVFEPTNDRGVEWVDYTLKQIEAAFRWNRPAIISSHRVNFCGHIDEENRRTGLDALRKLLEKITRRWPEVEFMSAEELGDLIAGES